MKVGRIKKERDESKRKYSDSLCKLPLDCVVEALPGNTIMHIGSGTNFFFVGTKAEYEARIDSIYKHYRDFYERLERIYTDRINGIGKSNKYKTKENKDKSLEFYRKAKENALNYLKHGLPIRERLVIKVYPRMQKDGIVIIVEGQEQGKYWDKSEWDREYKGGDVCVSKK